MVTLQAPSDQNMPFLIRRYRRGRKTTFVIFLLVAYVVVTQFDIRLPMLFVPECQETRPGDEENLHQRRFSGINIDYRTTEPQRRTSNTAYSYPENDDYVEQQTRKQSEQRTVYWYNSTKGKQRTLCSRYAFPPDLDTKRLVWQYFYHSAGLKFEIYGSYYDNRMGPPEVRILANINARKTPGQLKAFCQLWFYNSLEPIVVKVLKFLHIHFVHLNNQPYEAFLISCPIPQEYSTMVPHSVSLVEKECDFSLNNVNVIYNVPETGGKKDFAVCVKGLLYTHNDSAANLVEWLELLFALGVNKVYLHLYDMHPSVHKVLKYYEKLKVVETRYMSDPHMTSAFGKFRLTGRPANQFLGQQEVVSHQDCFYRNLYLYKYIGVFDVDEVIVPLKVNTWKELLDNLAEQHTKANDIASYVFHNVYFMPSMTPLNLTTDDIPQYMNIMKHVYRSLNHTPRNSFVKSIHSTDLVETLYQHTHMKCIKTPCKRFGVSTTDGQLQHYRNTCSLGVKGEICRSVYKKSITKDANIWRYKDRVVAKANEVLNVLGLV